jgi:hypothetical protein
MEYNEIFKKKFEELNELHTLVKENKFREDMHLNLKYGEGYFSLIQRMIEKFQEIVKLDKDGQLSVLDPFLFYHDFMSCATSSKATVYWLNRIGDEMYEKRLNIKNRNEDDQMDDWEDLKEYMVELENYIICIHMFLNTMRFDVFYAWDRGVFMRYEWNEDNKKYEPVHIVKEKKPGNKEYILNNNVFPTLKD